MANSKPLLKPLRFTPLSFTESVRTKVDCKTKVNIQQAANALGMTEAGYVRYILMNHVPASPQ